VPLTVVMQVLLYHSQNQEPIVSSTSVLLPEFMVAVAAVETVVMEEVVVMVV